MGPAHSLRAGPRTIRRGQGLAAHESLRALGRDRCPGQAVTLNSMETAAAPAAAGHNVTQAHDPPRTHPDLLQCTRQEACGGEPSTPPPARWETSRKATRATNPQLRPFSPQAPTASCGSLDSAQRLQHPSHRRCAQRTRATDDHWATSPQAPAGHRCFGRGRPRGGSANHTVRSSPITATRRLLASRAGRW